jgi:YidC/Oxa1 family membrane protein insertase
MDNKNVFVAIALSMAVLLFWGAFVETPKVVKNNISEKKIEKNDNNISPNINETFEIKNISRKDSIKNVERIRLENENIVGSISLKGAIIDDVSFKKHKQNIKDGKDIVFLNPQETENGFFVETGWTSVGNKIDVPKASSIWSVKGNRVLN